MTRSARIRLLIVTVALLSIAVAAIVPVYAQKLGPDGASNPTASVVDEQRLLKQAPRVEGRIDIPDTKAGVLIRPEGRTWEYFHEVLLHRGGAIVILGGIALLALAYFNL
jgi:formate dehydrogenase subunit gamma